MRYFLSPHSDDETLFGAYRILREKPIVVIITHATLQGNNGYERAVESYKAMQILGVPVMFLGINEDKLTEETLSEKLKYLPKEATYYIPEYEINGNPHHNLVNKVARKLFSKYNEYKTYTGLNPRTLGKEIIPTKEELELKKKAMSMYRTQIENPMTAHYFTTNKEYE